MDVMHPICCGIDVHQKSIVCCILDGPLTSNEPKKYQTTFGTTTKELKAALDWILEHQVTHVFFESTGQYWIPLFNIFSDSDLELVLANPQHIKNVPGRKTDVKDAEWIAQLGRCGLINQSYIPSQEVLQLRYLTRYRLSVKQRLTQIKNHIHVILQRANIKITSYLSDIFSKTGQALLTLFIDGEVINEDNVESCIHGRIKASTRQLIEAMEGKLSTVDRFLIKECMEEYKLQKKISDELNKEINEYILEHFPEEYQLLLTIPGISDNCCATILAEIGPNVDAFKTDKKLASWAGMCPGSNESAGVKKSSHTTQGNKYLKQALVMSVLSVQRAKEETFSLFYQRISSRGSKMKAIIACGHKMLRIIYKILQSHQPYNSQKALGLRQQTNALSLTI